MRRHWRASGRSSEGEGTAFPPPRSRSEHSIGSISIILEGESTRRKAALQRANIAAGFYNIVDGQRLATAQTLNVIDPGTAAFLAKVPDVEMLLSLANERLDHGSSRELSTRRPG